MDEKMLKQKMNTQLSGQTGENSAHMDTRLQQIINMERKIFHTMKDLAIRQFKKLM